MSRVLIVEDEPLIADFVKRGLEGQGYGATVTDDAERATALALAGDIDLIVLDLGLPVGDGFSVLRAVRERGERMPVIVLTGRPDLHDAAACLEGGANEYMTKPFHLDYLLGRVRALLGRADTGRGRPDAAEGPMQAGASAEECGRGRPGAAEGPVGGRPDTARGRPGATEGPMQTGAVAKGRRSRRGSAARS